MAGPPTGKVTFLFTDIQGSTAMWERDARRMQATLARHDEIMKGVVAAHGGHVFKMMGDACYAAFPSAPKALAAALAAQRAIFSEPWDERSRVRVRMALHTGEAEERDGDYFGPPLNRVSRLLSAGHGGQTLVSRAAREMVGEELPEETSLRDMGEHRLKDLKERERIFQLLAPDLPAEFPLLKTMEAPSEDDRYRLVKQIGSGGMAEVYLAYDEFLERDVAFKVLDRKYAQDKESIERFRREARNAASLHHPNIVAIHDRGETEDGTYYIVMEYLEGGTLEDLIAQEGALPPREAAEIAVEIADALQVAHERGIIHRDIKPQNILLTESGEAKVADFGIARAVAATTMTQAGSILGTVHYISPEQALGEPATPQSDLYSLGVVLYEMLTGELPYDAETPVGVVMKHVSGITRSPRDADPSVPEEIDAVAGRLLSRNPEERYPDAATLAEDLRTVAEGLPELTGAEGARAAGVRAARSKRGTRSGTSGRKLGTEAGAMWASSAKPPGGSLQRRGVLLAVALVLVSVGVIAFVALGREDQPTGAGAAQLEGKKVPQAGTLTPGAYKTDEFRPAFSFELPGDDTDDWRIELPEQPDFLDVKPTDYGGSEGPVSPGPAITFLNPSKVYPTTRFRSIMDPVPAPKDMVAWVRKHPDLAVNQEEAINVGGVPGTWFDVTVSFTGIPFFRTSNGADVLLSSKSEIRLLVLNDVAGEAIVIIVDGPKQQLLERTQEGGKTIEPFLPRAQKALASVEFAASGAASTTAPPVTDVPAETPSAEGDSAKGVKSIPSFEGQNPPSLSPGRYATRFFTPALSFEVGEGWAATSDSDGGFELLPQAEADDLGEMDPRYSSLGFNVIDHIYDPTGEQRDISSAPPENGSLTAPAPDDLIAWLQEHPSLKTSEPQPATVGGRRGTRIDVEVLPIQNYSRLCGEEPCVFLGTSDSGAGFLVPAGGKNRLIVLEDVEGETVLISSNAYPASQFDSITSKAQKVIDTVEWKAES